MTMFGGIFMSDLPLRQRCLRHMIKNLPVLRSKLEISQSQLAEKLGVTRQTITAIECGARPLSWTTFLALCFLFDSSPATRPLMELYEICPPELRAELTQFP